MAKAFLSHSSQNKDLVERVGRTLGKNNVHLDSLTFEAGEKAIEEIFSGLDNTDIFVLFISEPALNSPWIKKEISYAKRNLDKGIISRIFPLIIDRSVTYNDERIPDWIKKPYNIKFFDNEVIILQKLKQLIREANFTRFSHLRDINELYVGRHPLLDAFEKKIFNIDNVVPTCLISYSFIEGIGRRSFLKNALIRNRIVDKLYDPPYIPFSSKESIEDFIYKLNFIKKDNAIFQADLAAMDLIEKIELAKNLVRKYVQNNELIFLIDDGGIVLPNTLIAPWFLSVIDDEEFVNQVSICVVSKFKPKPILLRRYGHTFASFQVDELSSPEVQTLFIRYLSFLKIEIHHDDAKFFLRHLHGIPAQVIYTINLINSTGVPEAKQYIDDIDEFDEVSAYKVLDYLRDDELCKQILIGLSKFEIISYDLIHKIFGENEEVYRCLQKIFDLGLFYNVSSTHQYLKINNSVADYINRSKLSLDNAYQRNLREIIKEKIAQPLELNEDADYSEFLISIQEMLRSGRPIPSKYLIPSFILKVVVQEYYERNFHLVIQLAKKIIDASEKFDAQIIRETKYWLCQAYAWEHDSAFFEEIRYFNNNDDEGINKKDYFFLMGFYNRVNESPDRALEYFNEVLKIDDNHPKTLRELVTIYLRLGRYSDALKLAERNYENHKSNIHNINAYFTCMVNGQSITKSDAEKLQELLQKAKKSLHKNSEEFYVNMLSEYIYVVEGQPHKAISKLQDYLRVNRGSYHTFKKIIEICKKNGLNDNIEDLKKQYPHFA